MLFVAFVILNLIFSILKKRRKDDKDAENRLIENVWKDS
jgi:preprotein translocase subunit SecG